MSCLFCTIVKDRQPAFRVWENQSFMLVLDTKPINKGHLLLIPKRHFTDVFQMPEPWFSNLFTTAKNIAPILRRVSGSKRIWMAVEGLGIPHVHIHLVPVNKGNELNPLRARPATRKSLLLLQDRLVQNFRNLR